MSEKLTVEVGQLEPVTIHKLYGPTIFASLRITADLQRGSGCWIIERQTADNVWQEWVTVPAQLDADFDSKEEK